MNQSSGDSSGSENDLSGSEAPESVSFGKSRQDALESISLALKETRRLKELKKEKRRTQHALLKQQRKTKIDLSSAKLPESVLKEVSELDSQLKTQSTDDVPKTKTEDKHGSSDEWEDVDEDDGEEGDGEHLDTGSYLNIGGFHAVALSEEKHKTPTTKETALEFLNNHLYGSRIHRESVNKHISRFRKKDHKPALHFTKSGTIKKRKRKRKTKGRNWESLLPQ